MINRKQAAALLRDTWSTSRRADRLDAIYGAADSEALAILNANPDLRIKAKGVQEAQARLNQANADYKVLFTNIASQLDPREDDANEDKAEEA